MKLSRKLTPEEQTTISNHHSRISKAMKGLACHTTKLGKFEARLQELEGEHLEAERKANGGSVQASSALSGILDQKRRVLAQIEEEKAAAHDATLLLRGPVVDAQLYLSGVVGNDLSEQLKDRVEIAMAPFCSNRAAARHIAGGTEAMQAFGRYINAPVWSDVNTVCELAQRYTTLCAQALEGGELWEYTPAA